MPGCARHHRHAAQRTIPATPIPTPTPTVGYTETGIASWYGHPYHGRQAADGEIYEMETLVAAHRTLRLASGDLSAEAWRFDCESCGIADTRLASPVPVKPGR